MKGLVVKLLVLPLVVGLTAMGTLHAVKAASTLIGTQRTGAQAVKTFSSTITYSDIKGIPGVSGNDIEISVGELPANILVTSVYFDTPSPFLVNSDTSSSSFAGIKLQAASGGALNTTGSAIDTTAPAFNSAGSGGLPASFSETSAVLLDIHANDSANTGGLAQLTSGKTTVYITYMPYKVY